MLHVLTIRLNLHLRTEDHLRALVADLLEHQANGEKLSITIGTRHEFNLAVQDIDLPEDVVDILVPPR